MDVFREVNGASTKYDFALTMITDNLSIPTDGQRGYVWCAVEDSHNGLALILASDNINATMGDELRHSAFRDDLIALPPMQQPAQPAEHAVLCIRAPIGSKGIAVVVPEATREVLPDISVTLRLSAVQQDFHTVIKLGYTIDGQQ